MDKNRNVELACKKIRKDLFVGGETGEETWRKKENNPGGGDFQLQYLIGKEAKMNPCRRKR